MCVPRWGLLTLVIQFVLFLGFVSAGAGKQTGDDMSGNGLTQTLLNLLESEETFVETYCFEMFLGSGLEETID